MLEAVGVTKRFDDRTVIQGFSRRFETVGRYCLMGPSGCGKTTLVFLLMGLLKPDGGEVRGLKGLRLSAVFQEDRLLEQMTATANVRLAARCGAAEANQLLLALGLESESLSQPVRAFSGGMKRRVALCRALAAACDALFLDEPYKGLDEAAKARAQALVASRSQGKTVVLVTHDPREAEGYEVIRMEDFAAGRFQR